MKDELYSFYKEIIKYKYNRKKELVNRRIFKDFEQAKLELFQYVESRYNRHRIHSALNYLTPQQMEDKFISTA